jgi:hypothetical protein
MCGLRPGQGIHLSGFSEEFRRWLLDVEDEFLADVHGIDCEFGKVFRFRDPIVQVQRDVAVVGIGK